MVEMHISLFLATKGSNEVRTLEDRIYNSGLKRTGVS
jgi:hypothetical protein